MVSLLMMMAVAPGVSARGSHYTGRVEAGITAGLGSHDENRWQVTTTHGVTFGQERFFAGAGFGYGRSMNYGRQNVPLFVDVRYSLPAVRFQPYVGLQTGISIETRYTDGNEDLGDKFIVPKIGLRIPLNGRLKANVSVGYEFMGGDFYRGSHAHPIHVGRNGLMISAGVEF